MSGIPIMLWLQPTRKTLSTLVSYIGPWRRAILGNKKTPREMEKGKGKWSVGYPPISTWPVIRYNHQDIRRRGPPS